MATGAAAAYRRLPENSHEDIKYVAKEPGKWGQAIEKSWDKSKIGADHFKDTAGTLANILIGRKVNSLKLLSHPH